MIAPGAAGNVESGDGGRDRRISDRAVKIYLLSIDNRRFFFYADESEAEREEGDGPGAASPRTSGLWGWLHDHYERFKSAWERSEARVAVWTRRAWDWAHSWTHPDESMLVRLRSARRLELHHPASRHGPEVSVLWRDYLNHRWWRHLLWLSVNSIVAPFTLLLVPLPGPNVIGYWFTYRAIHHALIVWGIRRVRKGRIPLDLYPLTSLDRPIERDDTGKAKHAALDGDAAQLDEHVAWSESEPGVAIPGEGPAAAVAPSKPPQAGSQES